MSNKTEFEVGQPVVDVATMMPGKIVAISGTMADRYTYDIEGGSNGVTPNMIEEITGVVYRFNASGAIEYDGTEINVCGVYECRLIMADGDSVPPPSEEFVQMVQSWLQKKRQRS